MIGYWSPNCPVKTGRKDVLATVYQAKGKALVVVASWAKAPVKCLLKIDFKALGLDAGKARLHAPAISGLQTQRTFSPQAPLPIAPGRGWMLIVTE